MHLIRTLILLLFGNSMGLILFREHFRLFVESVATIFHSDWRKSYLDQHPHVKNRFKLTHSGHDYNASDFIYPMIITSNQHLISCLVHRNLKIARNRWNSSIIYVDILNLEYKDLPKDRAEDNRLTARIACKHVLQSLRRQRLFDQHLIEDISEEIHRHWMKRNRHTNEKHLMVPYRNLSQIEKDKDRKGVFIACRVFNGQFFFAKFNTTPIHFIGRIHQLN